MKEPTEPGYYWIKETSGDQWRPCQFYKGRFYIDEDSVIPEFLFEINETRIKNPDEK